MPDRDPTEVIQVPEFDVENNFSNKARSKNTSRRTHFFVVVEMGSSSQFPVSLHRQNLFLPDPEKKD
jgi:hypothetical protein